MRLLSPQEFGEFAVAEAIAGLVATALNLRLEDLLVRIGPDRDDGAKATLYAWTLVQSSISAAASAVALDFFGGLSAPRLLLVVQSFLTPIATLTVRSHEIELDFQRVARIEFAAHTLSHITAITLALSGVGVTALFARGVVLHSLRLVLLQLKSQGTSWRAAWILIRQINLGRLPVQSIGPLWLDGFAAQGFERLLILAVERALSTSATGLFFQARRLSIIPAQIVMPFASRVSLSYFARTDDRRELYKLVRRSLLVTIGPGLVWAASAFTVGPEIVRFAFGEQWILAAAQLGYMSGFAICFGPFNVMKSFLIARGRVWELIGYGQLSLYVVFVGFLLFASTASLEQWSMVLSACYAVALLMLLSTLMVRTDPRLTTDAEHDGR
ncbi:MAG: oligosaccharide flippase family protein [Myxococcota bacterium]